jgi:putative two-component system response regulator
MTLSVSEGGARILVIDDTPTNLRLLARALTAVGHRVRAACGGTMGIEMARAEIPDLVLLDLAMPDLDGFQVCEAMSRDPDLRAVPVIVISASHDTQAKVKALRAGGRDYITKPFSVDEMLARVTTHLQLRRLEVALADANTSLTRQVAEQIREISEAQMATIVALAKLSESRDDATGMHVVRIGEISRLLADAVRRRGDSRARLTEQQVLVIGKAAVLHDIGKVAIRDAVLLKPGKLTPEEFEVMKTHAEIGACTLEAALASYPRNELIRVATEIARSHHERWDGGGYPNKLAGEAIPLSARVVAVADVYDALRAKRPYKEPMTHDAAAAIVRGGAGSQFDRLIIDAFTDIEGDIERLWATMQIREENGAAAPAPA